MAPIPGQFGGFDQPESAGPFHPLHTKSILIEKIQTLGQGNAPAAMAHANGLDLNRTAPGPGIGFPPCPYLGFQEGFTIHWEDATPHEAYIGLLLGHAPSSRLRVGVVIFNLPSNNSRSALRRLTRKSLA